VSAGRRPPAWRRTEAARPLIAWTEAELSAVARLLADAQDGWRVAWGLSTASPPVSCRPAVEEDREASWQLAGTGPTGAAWIALPACFNEDVACGLWGAEAGAGPIARNIAQACRSDFQVRMRAALHLESCAEGARDLPAVRFAWSGSTSVVFGGGARLLLEGGVMQAALRAAVPAPAQNAQARGAPAALTPVTTALASLRLPLQARLADCELDLASVQDLRLGDVVAVPHRLDAPLLVRDAQGDVLFGAYLARKGERKALQLAALPSAGAPSH